MPLAPEPKFRANIANQPSRNLLTPQSDTEKAILAKLHSAGIDMSIKKGSFYACQGGWTRQQLGVDESTIIVMDRSAA